MRSVFIDSRNRWLARKRPPGFGIRVPELLSRVIYMSIDHPTLVTLFLDVRRMCGCQVDFCPCGIFNLTSRREESSNPSRFDRSCDILRTEISRTPVVKVAPDILRDLFAHSFQFLCRCITREHPQSGLMIRRAPSEPKDINQCFVGWLIVGCPGFI